MEETVEKTPETVLCNTCVAQNDKGTLDIYVNGIRIVGVAVANITNDGALVVALPAHAYRLAGRNESKRPVLETKDNVIAFPLMNEYRARWAKEEAEAIVPPPDGDGAA